MTSTIGFFTLLVIDIDMVQELAVTAGLGVAVMIFTSLLLLPVLLPYLHYPPILRDRLDRAARRREPLYRALAAVTRPASSYVILAGAVVLVGALEARNVRTGDLQAGVPELRPDSRYNRDTAFIISHFSIGVDILTVVVESFPDACMEHDVMAEIDRFAWHMENVPGVQSALSMPQVLKVINAGWNEGSLKWRVLPRDSRTMVQSRGRLERLITDRLLSFERFRQRVIDGAASPAWEDDPLFDLHSHLHRIALPAPGGRPRDGHLEGPAGLRDLRRCAASRHQSRRRGEAARCPGHRVGRGRVPGQLQVRNVGLPPNVVWACLAEVMVLALEGRFEVYTIGRNIELDKVREIYRLGLEHGMRLAAMSGVNGIITDEDFERVRKLAQRKRGKKARAPRRSRGRHESRVMTHGTGRHAS